MLMGEDHLPAFIAEASKVIQMAGHVFVPSKHLNYAIKLLINLWTNPQAKSLVLKRVDELIFEPALIVM